MLDGPCADRATLKLAVVARLAEVDADFDARLRVLVGGLRERIPAARRSSRYRSGGANRDRLAKVVAEDFDERGARREAGDRVSRRLIGHGRRRAERRP